MTVLRRIPWLAVATFLAAMVFADTAAAENVRAQGLTALRARPDTRARIVYRAPSGTPLEVLESRRRWIKVKVRDKVGWVTRNSVGSMLDRAQRRAQPRDRDEDEERRGRRGDAVGRSEKAPDDEDDGRDPGAESVSGGEDAAEEPLFGGDDDAGESSGSEDDFEEGGGDDSFIDETAVEESVGGATVHGYLQHYIGGGIRQTFQQDLVLFYERLQLDLEKEVSDVKVVVKPEIEFSFVEDSTSIGFRELYAGRFFGDFDVRVGKRIISWGVTDFWPVVDIVNPRDFTRLQNWRPIDEKQSTSMVQVGYVAGPFAFEALAVPLPEASSFELEGGKAFAFPFSLEGAPAPSFEDSSLVIDELGGGAKADLQLGSWTLSAYGFVGRNPLPSGYLSDTDEFPPELTVENERVAMGAASIQGAIDAIGTVVKTEAAYYERLDDQCEKESTPSPCYYLRQAPTARGTFSLETEIAPDLDAHAQFIGEYTRLGDLDDVPVDDVRAVAPGFFTQHELNPIVTLRLEGSWMRDKLRPVVFGYTSLADEDYFVNADLEYYVHDDISVAPGAFVFGGYAEDDLRNELTFAGSLEDASYVYLRATAWF